MEEFILNYVKDICSENLEFYDGRWHLKYGDESMNSYEIADAASSEFGITSTEAMGYVNVWKRREVERIEETNRKRIEDTVNFPIPEKTMALLHRLEVVFGIQLEFNEEPVYLYNRGGYPYAMAKGITLTHCTSSLIDGPGYDYSKEVMEILKPFGFEIENSYGDNGMDSATNWQDTYWHYDIVFKPSVVYLD